MTPQPLSTPDILQALHGAAVASPPESSPYPLRELRPFVEQQLLHSNEDCQRVLYPALEEIKQLLLTVYQRSRFQRSARQQPSAFMSYAWPILDIFPDEHWTQRFIVDFGLDCFRLGLNITIDCLHSRFGPSALNFMYQQVSDVDIVFPIGTRSFRAKMLTPRFVKSMVRHEFEEIGSRMRRCEEQHLPHGVMPFQLTAKNPDDVFIPPYKTHSAAESFQEMPYLSFLKELSYRLLFYFEHGLKDFAAITICKLDPTHPLTKIWTALELSDLLKPFLSPLPDKALEDFHLNSQVKQSKITERNQLYFQRLVQSSPLISTLSPTDISHNFSRSQETCYASALIEDDILQQWQLPPDNASYFVGRHELLEQLAHHFDTSQSKHIVLSAVAGLGGVGKSQLALYYAHHARELLQVRTAAAKTTPPTTTQYRWHLWFHAENESTLLNDYLHLGNDLGIVRPEEKLEQYSIVQRVKHFLEKNDGWLAVYDNAGSYHSLKEFIPQRGGHVLVTTRLKEWGQVGQEIEVKIFSRQEALLYLKKIIGESLKDEDKNLADLASELGYLPLALAHAAAFIKQQSKRGMTALSYLRMFENNKLLLLADKTLPLHSQEPVSFSNEKERTVFKTVATTWDISITIIEEEEKRGQTPVLARHLLEVMSFLSPDNIPCELLKRYLIEASYASDLDKAEILLSVTLRALDNYSLIQLNPNNTVSLHRLVQTVVRPNYTSNIEPLSASRINRIVLNLVETCYFFRDCGERSEEAIQFRKLLLSNFEYFNHYCELFQSSKNTTVAINHSLLLAKILFCIAGIYIYDNSEGERGLALLNRAKLLTSKDENIEFYGALLGRFGAAYCYSAIMSNQEKCVATLKILEEQMAILPPEHLELGRTYINLGPMFEKIDLHKPAKYLRKGLEIYQRYYPPKHAQLALVYYNIANFSPKSNAKEALQYCEKALNIYRERYSENNPNYILTLLVKGKLEFSLGSIQEAENTLNRAKELLEAQDFSAITKTPPPIWQIYKILAYRFSKINKFELSFKCMEKAIVFTERCYGKNSLPRAFCFLSYGDLYSTAARDYGEALSKYEEAFRIYKEVVGSSSGRIKELLPHLIRVSRLANNIEKLAFYQKLKIKMTQAVQPPFEQSDMKESVQREEKKLEMKEIPPPTTTTLVNRFTFWFSRRRVIPIAVAACAVATAFMLNYRI